MFNDRAWTRIFALLLLLGGNVLLANPAAAQNSQRPVALTGFNEDVIADGTYSGQDSVTGSTSSGIDTDFAYYALGFNPKAPTVGLPVGSAFASVADPNTTFLLQSAEQSNALLLTDQQTGFDKGTLNLVYPASFTSISILVTGLESSNSVSFQLNFQDGGAPVRGTFVAPDNFTGQGAVALAGFGRVRRDGDGFDDSSQASGDPRLYQVNIALSATNVNRLLSSIDFANLSSANYQGRVRRIAIFAVSGHSNASVQLQPLPVSGFNQDVIANGSDAPGKSTSATVDTVNTFYAIGYNPKDASVGLPAGGQFGSLANPNTTFALASAAGVNALLLTNGSSGVASGSLALGTPALFSSVAVLATGTNGDNPVNYTLQFADGGGSTNGSFTAVDNYSGNSAVALSGFGRVSRSKGVFDNESQTAGYPRLYETDLTLSKRDAARPLASIAFTNASPGGGSIARNVAIFALSGVSKPVVTGTAAFVTAGFLVDPASGMATIKAARTGGSAGPLQVAYATADGTAVAGVDYTAASGMLTWADGDTSLKQFAVPLLARPAGSPSASFLVNLSSVSGPAKGSIGTPSQATVTVLSSVQSQELIQGVFVLSPPVGIKIAQNHAIEVNVEVDAAAGALRQTEVLVSNDADGTATSLGTTTAERDRFYWTPPNFGSFHLQAVATDTAGKTQTTSHPIVVSATLATDAGPQVQLQGGLEGQAFAAGQSVTLAASALDSNGQPLPSVQFYLDGQPIGSPVVPSGYRGSITRRDSGPSSPGVATLDTRLTEGLHLITAAGTDGNGVTGVSNGQQIFAKSAASEVVACSFNNPVTGSAIPSASSTLMASVAASSSSGAAVNRVELFVDELSYSVLTAPPFDFTLPPLAPGMHTLNAIATDVNGLSGSATVVVNASGNALSTVTLAATIPTVAVGSGGHGEFTLTRSGGDVSAQIAVNYSVKGTASNGVDYTLLSGVKKMKSGKSAVKLTVVPLSASAAGKTVKLTLQSGLGYTVGTTTPAKVKILAGQ